MGRKKDAERRKRREQRMAERMHQTQTHNDLLTKNEKEDSENHKRIVTHDDISLSTSSIAVLPGKTNSNMTPNISPHHDQGVNFNENSRNMADDKSVGDCTKEGMILAS